MNTITISIILYINTNPTKGAFARPYDSSQGMSSNLLIIMLLGLALFTLYIVYRVWKSIRDEERGK